MKHLAKDPTLGRHVGRLCALFILLLTYFETRPDKLFVITTAPPMAEGEYASDAQPPAERAANAHAFND